MKTYYEINKDKICANSRKYYDDNADYILKRMAEYFKENREKKLLYNKEYYKIHRDEIIRKQKNRCMDSTYNSQSEYNKIYYEKIRIE